MKTDRELLELAARASGLNGYIHEWINGPEFIIPGGNPVTWNPLTDDGDALRLAVTLNMGISIPVMGKDFARIDVITFKDSSVNVMELCHGDPYAATRRAIVRAAAEIQLQKEREQ